MTLRQDRVASSIKKLAGEFLKEESNGTSMITPIRADVAKDLKNSTIYVTVFPEDREADAINFLKRKRGEFRDFFKAHIKIRVVPFFDFKIDIGEKHRQKIDSLMQK